MMVKPMKTLELHYPMIQFLVIDIIRLTLPLPHETCCSIDKINFSHIVNAGLARLIIH